MLRQNSKIQISSMTSPCNFLPLILSIRPPSKRRKGADGDDPSYSEGEDDDIYDEQDMGDAYDIDNAPAIEHLHEEEPVIPPPPPPATSAAPRKNKKRKQAANATEEQVKEEAPTSEKGMRTPHSSPPFI